MRALRAVRCAACAALSLALLACSTPAPPDAGSAANAGAHDEMPLPSTANSPNPQFERKQRERALLLTRQGRLAEAALAWEVLTVLRPDASVYSDRLSETRRQIDLAANDRMQRAAQAQKRGEIDSAAQQYLAVLALAPEQEQAAEALRAIERERNKRYYLGKYSRFTLTRRSIADATVQTNAPESNELEHASILASQGDVDDAIAVLERRVGVDRRDDAARFLLADIYFQKADKLAARDKKGAIAALERCLRLDPAHARATALLKQVKAATAPATSAASGPSMTRTR